MLDIKFIKEHKDIVEKAIRDKRSEPVDLDRVLALYEERRKILSTTDELNRRKNEAAQKRDIEEGKKVKEELQKHEERLREVMKEFTALMVKVPNIPSPDTPVGPDESANKVLRTWGKPSEFQFEPKAHWDIGRELDLIDTERAGQISGARFNYLKGDAVLLQFALIKLVMDTLTSRETLEKITKEFGVDVDPKPFVPVIPPVMIKPYAFQAMARLEPKEERYYIQSDDAYLVGSAEHTLGAMHMDEILQEKDLPLRYIGYSTAFRREAGSYGKDTKGILRQHQFDKAEMESFCLPENSYKEQDFFVAIQEYLTQKLEIPYQVIITSTGDMGDPDHRHLDIEMWMAGQGKYRETHSADLMGGYQARRLNSRVKRADGKIEYVHMNDATAFAIGRTLIAILENYQRPDGAVVVPLVLQPYLGKGLIEKRA